MKMRAKQLAMLGLVATMTCGTPITIFAAAENEVKVETNKETEEVTDNVTSEEAELPVEKPEIPTHETKSDTSVSDTILDTEVPEVKPETPAPEVKPETPAPEEQTPAAPVFVIPQIKVDVNTTVFDGTKDIEITYTVTNWDELTAQKNAVVSIYAETFSRFYLNGVSSDVYVPVSEPDTPENVVKTVISKDAQKLYIEDFLKKGLKNGDTLSYKTSLAVEQIDENNWDYRMNTNFEDFTNVSFTYSDGKEPEQPEQNPDGNDDGNGNTQTPEQPEQNPDSNGSDTQKPDTQKPDEQKPNDQKSTTGTPVNETKQPAENTTKAAPKTSDASAVFPLFATSLSSMGVVLGTMFKRRK